MARCLSAEVEMNRQGIRGAGALRLRVPVGFLLGHGLRFLGETTPWLLTPLELHSLPPMHSLNGNSHPISRASWATSAIARLLRGGAVPPSTDLSGSEQPEQSKDT